MGKFEIQSMPLQRNDNNFILPHSNCKGLYSEVHSPNGISNESTRILNDITSPVENDHDLSEVEEEEDEEEIDNLGLVMPLGMKSLATQVAGHKDSENIGMLTKDGKVYKPLLKPECAKREIQLYEQLDTTVDRSLMEMKQLVPKYYGTKKIIFKDKEVDYLVLEDLTKEFREPCVMDIKIGKRTWDPYASYNKIIAEEKKYHECKRDLGFCIPGMQVYNIAQNQLVKYGKDYGKTLNKDGAREVMKEFLNANSYHFCRKLLMQLLASLWQIQHFARCQRRLRLYASSILLVYDARRLKQHVGVTQEAQAKKVTLRRNRSLYRPLSLATLSNGCEKVPTGFSGQLTKEGHPILKPPSTKIVNLEGPRIINNNNTWHKSMRLLKRTHSFQNNYDKDVQHKKQNYNKILDDLCSDSKSEVWATAKLIDFAHVYPADNMDVDKNYLEGVDNLVKMLEDFLAETDE
ncbi:hypothetical protein GWI33_020887 [Rhynchophorus ferrugineus]|uniref:Kinase n=1 Tax=Rhynchophorus ferrugineus TaxID=354439 RepID=A0A834M315_RHYFE|nr:hypothetical protein GWI33_020887 [Rhynchophorus ferrugineus]